MLQYGRGVPVVRTDVEHRQVVVSEEKGCRERKFFGPWRAKKSLARKHPAKEKNERRAESETRSRVFWVMSVMVDSLDYK